ncbi:MAG: tetratricopeptide repeat protein [Candidatus Kapabacteria bacterium]|nr:tetratricopeptide repeat protein [Candidatus Kapabacteria bacterium]
MASPGKLLQRFFRRGNDGAVYFVLDSTGGEEKCAQVLDRAAHHWRRGEYEEAIELAEAATKLDPTSEVAVQILLCYAIEAEQREVLERIIQRLPEHVERQMPFIALHAVQLAWSGEQEKALHIVESLSTRHAQDPYYLFATAEIFRYFEKWEYAARQFRALYKSNSDFPYGHIHAAQVLVSSGATEEAINILELRLRSQPRHAELYHWLGICYEMLNQSGKALQCYREALSIRPDHHLTHARIGALERRLGHYASALHHLRIAHANLPSDRNVAGDLIAVLVQLQQWDDAARLIPTLIQDDPTLADIEVALTILDNTAHQAQVYHAIEKARHLFPQNPWLWYAEGIILFRRKQFDEAKDALKKSIELSPSSHACIALGRVYAKFGEKNLAIEQYNAALMLDKTNVAAWQERCLLRLDLHQPEQALADIEHALRIAPNVAQLHYLRGRCYLEIGNEEAALDSLTRAVHLDSNCIDAWLLSSQIWRQRGDYAQAIYALKQILTAMPDDIAAHMAMAETQLALGRMSAASQHIQRVRQAHPEQGEQLYLQLGKSLETRNLYNRALELYEEALTYYPTSADIRFRYGYVALKCGAFQICLRQIEELAGLDPIRAATLRDVCAAFRQSRAER